MCKLGLEETRDQAWTRSMEGHHCGNTFSTREAEPGSQKFQNMSLQWQPDHLQGSPGHKAGLGQVREA